MTGERELEVDLEELARGLPSHEPNAVRRDAMRAALLEEARAAPPLARRPSRALVGAGVVAALAAGLLLWWSARPPGEPGAGALRAAIQSSSGADFEHTRVERSAGTRTAPTDEVVRLRQGRVALNVEHLSRRERFRVVTGDAEVEVRGTTFHVIVDADKLVEVAVTSGVVDVRPRGGEPIALEAGHRWRADDPVARPVATVTATESTASASTPTAPTATASPDSLGPLAAASPEPAATHPSPAVASSPRSPAAGSPIAGSPAAGSPIAGSPAAGSPAARPPPAGSGSRTSPTPDSTPSAIAETAPTRNAPSGEDRDATTVPEAEVPETRPPTADELAPAPGRRATASEVAFGQGFRAVRQGNYGEAASLFELAIRLGPETPLAADARFWLAVARARAGAGRDELADFLARHPGHARAGEASAMLGWKLLEAGDRNGAAWRFRAALRDRDPAVRASAEKGMAAIR
jgi:TolA-binding protein